MDAVIGRPIGETHGEQCKGDDPYWWCDDCQRNARWDCEEES